MEFLKKYFIIVLFFLSFFFLYPQKQIQAVQTADICYSQCIAYKFVWQGTYCYDVFADNCTQDSGNTIIKTIKLLKDVYDTVKSGDNIDIAFKAWFVCKPLIEQCIVPQQQNCRQTCSLDQYVYAPDLSVGHPESSFQGVYYDENTSQLYFKLVNNGLGYAWNIDVEATSGHTPNRDGLIQGGTQLFKEKVEHLIYFGARNGPPKSFSDVVTDFLINQAENGQYLKGFKKWLLDDQKSDKKDYNVPSYWIKAVPFHPVAGELNRVIFNVDPNNLIPESNEYNNTYIFDLDLRPTPARYSVESLAQHLVAQTLNSFKIDFKIKNTGEEAGSARLKIYEGKYQDGQTPIFETDRTISGKDSQDFTATLDLNAKNEAGPYCGKLKKYTLVVFDEEGNKTEREFSLPIYIGSVTGRVTDLFGKKVIGATIKASTGEETTVNDSGYYHLEGITSLGKITITATHPEFSQPTSKELEFKFGDEFKACEEGNLKFNDINFILKDQDVLFTVTVKDTSGNPLNAHVLAVNSDFRKEWDINGSGTMPELQPGEYTFIISAGNGGYKTISQTVNAVPNDQNLEFVLEKLAGRQNDFTLLPIAPRLLWEKTLGSGEKIIGNMSGSKSGQLLVASVGDNKSKTRKLFFLDLMSGNQKAEISVPYSVEQQRFIGLDTSYDGATVGLFVNPGTSINKMDGVLKIFNATGNELGTTTLDHKLAISMDVSPDGFYVCPYLLLDKGLHKYTKYETEGQGDDNFQRNPATCDDHLMRNNHRITTCGGQLCEKTIANQEIRIIGNVDGSSKLIDSTYDSRRIAVRTANTLYFFSFQQDNPYANYSWSKNLKSDPNFKSVAISPEGSYTIVTDGDGGDTSLKLKIYKDDGQDKTPSFPYKDVRFVFANDKGLFFASVVLNHIKFYQVGEYNSEYNAPTVIPTTSLDWVSGISRLGWADQFTPTGSIRFQDLDPGVIYRADQNINMAIIPPFSGSSSLGTLSITKDTLFSVDNSHNAVLLKGQMVANFGSPATVYAIKFDRFWLHLFQEKLDKFITHSLPEDEYFIVKNIHTKFTIKNNEGNFNVAVDNGEVKILSQKIDLEIKQGRQVYIDKNNIIKETGYVNLQSSAIIVGLLILVFGALLFHFRKTKAGGKIIEIIKKLGILILKIINQIVITVWVLTKKLFINLRKKNKKL